MDCNSLMQYKPFLYLCFTGQNPYCAGAELNGAHVSSRRALVARGCLPCLSSLLRLSLGALLPPPTEYSEGTANRYQVFGNSMSDLKCIFFLNSASFYV